MGPAWLLRPCGRGAADQRKLTDSAPDNDRRAFEAVPPGRLDAFLAAQLEAEASRSKVQAWIKEGRAEVDGKTVTKPGHKLRGGEAVSIEVPPPPPPPGPLRAEDLPLDLLYQDEHILVLDKPAGLTIHPGAGQREGTLVNALLHHSPGALSAVGGEERPGIVHRLDKETSGVLVVARTDNAHRELARQFHDREVRKTYMALTAGTPARQRGRVGGHIGRHPQDRKRMALVPEAKGRLSSTRYEVVESHGPGRGFALVRCHPKTGRTHQIRVHLQSLGAPLLGDKLYGRGPTEVRPSDLGLEGDDEVLLGRHALHAARLQFKHPASGEPMSWRAPLPADMEATLEALRRHSERGGVVRRGRG